jgi:3-hydroxyisobutyrate dehydrogenase-like beta-hydroxyacid dehydrogenase
MKRKIGFIGLGDMGGAMSTNFLKAGYQVSGFDLKKERLASFSKKKGQVKKNAKEVGESSDVVFLMVLNGNQAKQAIFEKNGLCEGMKKGDIIITATIKPQEIKEIDSLLPKGVNLLDSPVTGGFEGATNASLTFMVSGAKKVFERNKEIYQSIGKKSFYIGAEVGQGQTIKAALQSLIGSIFTATFEAAVFATKGGISAETLLEVFTASGASCNVVNNSLDKIIHRKFQGTGSHIGTMYKDLGISLDLARELGVPLFTASAATQLFQAGKNLHPEGDNWAITKVLEQISQTKIKKTK